MQPNITTSLAPILAMMHTIASGIAIGIVGLTALKIGTVIPRYRLLLIIPGSVAILAGVVIFLHGAKII